MRVYVVRKWPLRGRSRFVFWNITRVSVWLLCNVHFLQSKQRTRLQTRQFVRGINSLLKMGVCASRNQVVFDFLARNVCNHGKHYETPCICVCNWFWLEILWLQGWDVDHAMYSTPWYTYSQKYKKHLVLVIMRAQRPVEITVGHYYSLSLQSCELVGRQQFMNFCVCGVHVLEQKVEMKAQKL